MRTTYALCCVLVACGAAPAQEHDAPQPLPTSPCDTTDAGADVANLESPADAVVTSMQLALDDLVAPLKPSDCVREARSRLEVALRSAKERRDELHAALCRRDHDLASHAYAAILILSTRAAVAADEAQRCP
jgi:hypothetical protein